MTGNARYRPFFLRPEAPRCQCLPLDKWCNGKAEPSSSDRTTACRCPFRCDLAWRGHRPFHRCSLDPNSWLWTGLFRHVPVLRPIWFRDLSQLRAAVSKIADRRGRAALRRGAVRQALSALCVLHACQPSDYLMVACPGYVAGSLLVHSDVAVVVFRRRPTSDNVHV